MAKSKQQKQEEALARKRQNYNLQLELYMGFQPGGDKWKESIQKLGPEVTAKRLLEVNSNWKRYLKEAQLDSHGNPLTAEEFLEKGSFNRVGIARRSFKGKMNQGRLYIDEYLDSYISDPERSF